MTEPEADAREAVFWTPEKFTGNYGSYTLDEVSGSWTDTLNNSNNDANALTAGLAAGAQPENSPTHPREATPSVCSIPAQLNLQARPEFNRQLSYLDVYSIVSPI